MSNDKTFYASNNPEGKPKSTTSGPAPDLKDGVGEATKSKPNGSSHDDAGMRTEEIDVVDDTSPALSEQAVASEFVALYADTLRYVAKWKQWFIWDGKRWKEDDKRAVYALANQVCREHSRIADKRALTVTSATFRSSVVSLASDDQYLAATVDEWDKDIWLLNTPEGVVDLKTGVMREHRASDLMRMMSTVAPRATRADGENCPLWIAFLREIMDGDDDLVKYLQRVFGYCLTGSIREHQMWFGYGSGNNGKGVIVEVVTTLMGDYALNTPIETFTVNHSDRHPEELARLQGKRLVTSAETEQGRRWAESRIKDITGGGKVTARFMRQNSFDFLPQLKLFLTGNHMPVLRNVGPAIERRFNRVPFSVKIAPELVNPNLAKELLENEGPGILLWMLQGCVEWQRSGLGAPEAVKTSTAGYLSDQDVLGQWIADCCEKGEWVGSTALFNSWKAWATAREEFVGSQRSFSMKLEDHGWVKKKDPNDQKLRGFAGWKLKQTGSAPNGDATDEGATDEELPF